MGTKDKSKPFPHSKHKKVIWDYRLKCKSLNHKVSRIKKGRQFGLFGWAKILKIDKPDFNKTRNFCLAKGITTKIKTQPTNWEEIFIKHKFGEELLSRIYKELIWHNIKKKI